MQIYSQVLKNVKKGLSIDKLTKKPTWFCSLCNLTGDYGDMGPLFGPFDIYVPPKVGGLHETYSVVPYEVFEMMLQFKLGIRFSEAR